MDPSPATSPQKSARLVPSPTKPRPPSSMAGSKDHTEENDARPPRGMSGLLAERLAAGGGALCNDERGLCLGSRGDVDASAAGVYTSIAKLAGQLDDGVEGGGGGGARREAPLVTLQTETAALLVKEYGGRTVVFRVPKEAGSGEGAGSGEASGDAVPGGAEDAAKAS